MNELVCIMKLVFLFDYEFISAPCNSLEEKAAYECLKIVREQLAKKIGRKQALIYGEHMEHLAARKRWEWSRDKYSMYLSMRSKYSYENSL